MQPINYIPQQQSDFAERFLSGLKAGASLGELHQQQQAREKAQKMQEQYALDLQSTMKNPTAQAFGELALKYPGQREAILASGKYVTEAQQNTLFGDAAKIYNALDTGKADAALSYATQKRDALKNSGRDFSDYEEVISAINTNPEAAKSAVGIIGASLDPKKWLEIHKAPSEISESQSKATQEGVKAEFARPVAMAELAKTKAETLAPAVRESIDFANLKPEQQATFQALQILKKPPAAVTNVNVSNVDKTAAAELGKLVPDLYNQANSAATQLSDLPRYQAALDSAITGPFAEQRLSTARVASAMGFTGDKAVNATREVIQGLSEMALKSRTMLTGQGQITEGEQKLLIKARSGDINFTKGELKTIFGVADRAAKAQYNQSRKLLESAAKQSPTAQMFLENMQPLATQAAPATAAAVPGMPAGFRVIQRGQ
jgi:hypothetical protein